MGFAAGDGFALGVFASGVPFQTFKYTEREAFTPLSPSN